MTKEQLGQVWLGFAASAVAGISSGLEVQEPDEDEDEPFDYEDDAESVQAFAEIVADGMLQAFVDRFGEKPPRGARRRKGKPVVADEPEDE